ncbi:hypothetical protein PTTG_05117 [Puccinia triticina 1-1 BBBD Race 1]|uniref:Uncharacterized protein n=1 Tax=Puccinia triticina (isolate 1-1 / race 1 (BBBD)) TaxID=630390 RepID=A0A0C4EWC3_PUCT1|nr:hypothetical protein PTTG_05117 [Puccinia triticina 1-1 BBBD Race 1]
MALNNSVRGIRLRSLLMSIFLAGGCMPMHFLDSKTSTKWFDWNQGSFGLDHVFHSADTSAATATAQPDRHQPFFTDYLHPIGLPAGPSATHWRNSPLLDNYPAPTASEERPAHSQAHGMSLASDELLDPGRWDPQFFDDLGKFLAGGTPDPDGLADGKPGPDGLADGTPGPNGLAAAGASQTHSGVPHVLLGSYRHPIAGAGPSYVPAILESSFPSSYSGPDQRFAPVVKSLKPQTHRTARARARARLRGLLPSPAVRNSGSQRTEIADPSPRQGRLMFDLTFFAINDPSDFMQTKEVDVILQELKKIPNHRLVIPESKFISIYPTYNHVPRESTHEKWKNPSRIIMSIGINVGLTKLG